LLAYHLLCASKKGMSAHQLHRMLKVTYRSAWFMAHRIRYTMSQEPLSSKLHGVIEKYTARRGPNSQSKHRRKTYSEFCSRARQDQCKRMSSPDPQSSKMA
jgi:hypothetical protein